MQAHTIAPATIVRSRRDPRDIEIILRFDPASPIARTEVEVESEEHLVTAEYLAVVSDGAAGLAMYAGDYRAALEAEQGTDDDEGSPRRPAGRRPVARRHSLQPLACGAWTLRTLQDGALALVGPHSHVIVTATHGPSQERLRRLFNRMSTRTSRAYYPLTHGRCP